MRTPKRLISKAVGQATPGRDSAHVGTVVYSPYFGAHLIVTRYISDNRWWFRFADRKERKEYRAQSPLSHFIKD